MGKRKGRAARKQQRERVEKARERGLPAAVVEAPPARVLRPGGDVAKLAIESGRNKGGVAKAGRARAAQPAGGIPMLAKVALGAAVALGVVFALSQMRKSSRPALNSPSDSPSLSSPPGAADSPSSAVDAPSGSLDALDAARGLQPSEEPPSDMTSNELAGVESVTDLEAPTHPSPLPTPKIVPGPSAPPAAVKPSPSVVPRSASTPVAPVSPEAAAAASPAPPAAASSPSAAATRPAPAPSPAPVAAPNPAAAPGATP